jgi:3-dehydroquinate dehydratase / shikimate dehydrogenase
MALDVDRVCVIIGRTRHKMVMVELQEAVKRGVSFIELRLDFLSKAVDFPRLMAQKKCTWIATIRRREDGGRFAGTETERLTMLRQAIVGGFDWVDLESDIADKIPRFGKVKRIVSYHNLQETPANLEEIFEKMCQQEADVLKIATTATKPGDNIRVLKLIEKAPKPTIGHCMGDMGIPSRLLSLKYGAPFMYAAFNKERGIAPGLPSLEELRRFYNINGINKETKVYGVLGDPVAQSMSPLLHNHLFKLVNINAVYLPFRVPRGQLNEALRQFEYLPCEGYSVTIPHKESAAQLATSSDPGVEDTQAANTLVRKQDGFWAANTDYPAVLDCIRSNQPMGEENKPKDWKECKALLLGAGGAARAAAYALLDLGIPITVSSRTLSRAETLASEVKGQAIDWATRHREPCDVVVNCTPIGMHPEVDESPIHASFLQPGMVVFDTVYNPETTLLVKDARDRGCTVITGVEMFVRQAAKQFKYFTDVEPDLEKMREIVRRALSPVTSEIRAIDPPQETEAEAEEPPEAETPPEEPQA